MIEHEELNKTTIRAANLKGLTRDQIKRHTALGYNFGGLPEGGKCTCIHCGEPFIYGTHVLYISRFGNLREYCPKKGCDGSYIDFWPYEEGHEEYFDWAESRQEK